MAGFGRSSGKRVKELETERLVREEFFTKGVGGEIIKTVKLGFYVVEIFFENFGVDTPRIREDIVDVIFFLFDFFGFWEKTGARAVEINIAGVMVDF